jgi:putative 4-mercaptohistidine N1-methyltranferase
MYKITSISRFNRSHNLFKSSVKMSTNEMKVRSTTASGSQVYESKRAVDEYLLFHYGTAGDQLTYKGGPHSALKFPERCAQICADYATNKKRALDVGCAVGGSTFELAAHFDEVIGMDFSNHFVDAANTMKKDGKMSYEILKQGNVFKSCETNLSDKIDRDRCSFHQGDACDLRTDLGQFDIILASNLVCRLPQPMGFLERASSLLSEGGCLVLVSPYSWLEEYTPMDKWIGGNSSEEDNDCFEALSRTITSVSKELKLVHREDVPFLIREHERKYQYGVSDCTIWRKN